jgi:hypothetical protein
MPHRALIPQRLAEIWRAILDMDCIGIDGDYSDLGGFPIPPRSCLL